MLQQRRGALSIGGRSGRAHREAHGVRWSRLRIPKLLLPGLGNDEGVPLGFVFHRPRFFGKTFTSIVVQGIYGGAKIVKYLDFVGNGLGFNSVKGTCVTALEPATEKERQKIDRALAKLSKRFHKRLTKPAYPVPTLFNLLAFRMARTSMKLLQDDSYRDYTYFTNKGWFESEYFYATHLGPLKKLAGSFFDSLATIEARRRRGCPVA